ncbi:MAG: DNA replication/repair protein RecF [Clostridia bacterium]|nr:DNA replication/repair protein RecF [Clostridia bacterium]
MKVQSLQINNFRNYKNLSLTFDDKVNVFIGKNAQGKTNLLESIFYCCLGKSFKTTKDKDLILWGEEKSKILLTVNKKYRDVKVEINLSTLRKKSISLDDFPIKRIAELIGEVNVVFFSPQELKLVKESPEERRKFMDIDLCQNNKRYFYQLSRYEKILANRNKLLKFSKTIESVKETIEIWDRALVAAAKFLATERAKFVEQIAPYSQKAHHFISGGKENLRLKYKCGCGVSLDEKFEENMDKLLKKNLEKDYKLGHTTIGVHRDDIDIFLNDVEVKNFGSQGQQRTVALSLKLAELENMFNLNGEYPILLLDDVFSELDVERQSRLLKFVGRTQTFITCTDEKKIDGTLFSIVDGTVVKKEEKKIKNNSCKVRKNRLQ